MPEYPIGAQILPAPPPAHPLRDKYTGRLLLLPNGHEVLLDPSLLRDDNSIVLGVMLDDNMASVAALPPQPPEVA